MTEQQFKDILAGMPGLTTDAALHLAKEAGAKFDPEPVELPPLGTSYTTRAHFVTRWGLSSHDCFTAEQAAEIVRRCNAWPELRHYADSPDDIRAILDGRSVRRM